MHILVSYCYKNHTEYFRPDDDLKSFKRNLRKSPSDWIYRTKEIEYSTNEYGFRNISFKDVDWGNSIVLTGCSFVFGVGLAYEDTISQQLSSILNLNVVNLGLPGSGIDLAFYNSLILHNHFPHPKALVHMWSHTTRYCNFLKYDNYDNSLVDNAKPYNPYAPNYIESINWGARSNIYRMADNTIWANKTQYIELSFFEETASEFKIPKLPTLDVARDLKHPGILTAKNAAMEIAKLINI